MEPKASLIRPDSRVELNSVPSVDLDVSLVVSPGDPEADNAFGFDYPFDYAFFFELGMELDDLLARFQDFGDRLQELRLMRVSSLDGVINALQIRISDCHDKPPKNM